MPASDPEKLGQWFRDSADSGSLERYLETFAHTVAVLQTEHGLTRVAREAAEDLAEDGVVGSYNGSNAREVLLTPEDWEAKRSGV